MIQTKVSKNDKDDVNAINKQDTITAKELTIPQNNTLDQNIFDTLMGNVFIFSIANPSRVIFVEQKVLVKTPKSKTTDNASAKFMCIPKVLNKSVCSKEKQQYTINGIDNVTEKYENICFGSLYTQINSFFSIENTGNICFIFVDFFVFILFL